MSLGSEYSRQSQWRDWPTLLDALGTVEGATVLDLGCAVGDMAALLAARGARVIGIDADEELVREARSRGLPASEFLVGDLRAPLPLDVRADGLWCGFVAAYFPDL